MSLSEYFLNSASNIVQIEAIQISHSSFSQDYRIVRNYIDGVTLRVDGQDKFFEYYPLKISQVGVRDDLDFGLSVDLGDLGEIIPEEIDNVMSNNNFSEKPILKYWAFRSDNLINPIEGPIDLEITSVSSEKRMSSLVAVAPFLNVNITGQTYKLDDFPMLVGFL